MTMKSKVLRILIPAVLLALGIALMVFGIVRGEAFTVFQKAVRICLECIGVG